MPGSMDKLPMLLASSLSFDPVDPFDDGRELPLRNVLRGLESRGDFGAVRGEKPEGGLAVRITGGLAASSSKDVSSSIRSLSEG
jgi:hypothetical protein